MDPKVAVVTPISPAAEVARDRASYEELWRDSVATKALVADLANKLNAALREIDDLRIYCRKHVKRLDAVASRIERARG